MSEVESITILHSGPSRPPTPVSHHRHRVTDANLLHEAAWHAAQTRWLIRRALCGMDSGDRQGFESVCDALHALAFRLEKKGQNQEAR